MADPSLFQGFRAKGCAAATALTAAILLGWGCDHGLSPPDEAPLGAIRGVVRYAGTWPPEPDVHDLRFVAMRFVPTDTTDFLQLNLMAISERLRYGVEADTFEIAGVEPGIFVYSGIAQQFSSNVLSWRPLGLFTANDGIFEVPPGGTAEIELTVDFAHPPVFPPPGF